MSLTITHSYSPRLTLIIITHIMYTKVDFGNNVLAMYSVVATYYHMLYNSLKILLIHANTLYWEIFASLNFRENGNFNNFANDLCGQHKRCGMAIFRGI